MTSWEPYSPCEPACARHRLPPVSASRAVTRWLALTGILAIGCLLAPCLAVLSTRRRDRLVRWWACAVLRASGVRLRITGDPGRSLSSARHRGTLLVANHISWLDICVLLAIEPATFLAKREVRDWPVLGLLATRAGTFFHHRGRLRELPETVARLADTLRSGRSVVVFPEGTTWCRAPGGTFRRAPFQAAIDAGAPVRPLSIGYAQAGEPSTVTAFVGDDTLVNSLRRVLRARDVTVELRVHPALHGTAHTDRRQLAARAQLTCLPSLTLGAPAASEVAHA